MSEGLSIVGSSRNNGEREKDDFYPSPPHTIDDLLKFEDIQGVIREPACGDGAMSKRLEELGKQVISSDLIDRGYGQSGIDFLSSYDKVDCIITNPPYKYGQEFVEHALEITKDSKGKVCMLMKLVFLESASRYKMFKKYPLKKVLVYSKRLKLKKNNDKSIKGSSMMAFARFIWDWSYELEPMIDWII